MTSSFDRDVWAILGMPIDNVTLDQAVTRIERAVELRERLSFVTPNVNWLVRALKDPDAMRQIVDADLSLADGAPIVWLARKLGMPLKERVAGADLFERLRAAAPDEALPIKVFFFGGREGAAETAHQVLSREQGRLIAAGHLNPGHGDVESMSTQEIVASINAADPDFVLVSLGAAKGQDWIERNQDQLNAPVIAHLGAVVDFVAGTIRRAPKWMREVGLEWLWRIFADPMLCKRYWNDGRALLGFIRRRVGPLQRAAQVQAAIQPAIQTQSVDVLKMAGDLVVTQRNALRQALSDFAQNAGNLTLDLTGVRSVDASALGQVRMLERETRKRGDSLTVKFSPELEPAFQAANMTA